MARRAVLLIAAVACCASQAAAQPSGERAYVQASRVSVRGAPSTAAAVVGYLTTNAEVRIESRQGEWCRIAPRVGSAAAFVSCAFLANAALTEETIRAKLADQRLSPKERLDWASRAFWVSPSLTRWVDVGQLMEEASSIESTVEGPKGKKRRAQRADFDAMKQQLEQGVTVTTPPAEPYFYTSRGGSPDPIEIARRRAALPVARPSYFGEHDVPYAVPIAPFGLGDALHAAVGLVDALSAVHRTAFRSRIVTPARELEGHALGGTDTWLSGAWDAGTIGVTFDKEALIHGVTARGRSVAVRVDALTIQLEDESCPRTPLGFRTRLVKGPRLASALLAWVGKPPIDGQTTVAVRRFGGKGSAAKLVIEDLDLDGDGVADFSVWAGRYRYLIADNGTEGYWKAIFANVAGRWRLVGYDQDDECT
jgi:hypothetical protein